MFHLRSGLSTRPALSIHWIAPYGDHRSATRQRNETGVRWGSRGTLRLSLVLQRLAADGGDGLRRSVHDSPDGTAERRNVLTGKPSHAMRVQPLQFALEPLLFQLGALESAKRAFSSSPERTSRSFACCLMSLRMEGNVSRYCFQTCFRMYLSRERMPMLGSYLIGRKDLRLPPRNYCIDSCGRTSSWP